MAFFEFVVRNFVLVLVALSGALLLYLRPRIPTVVHERAGQMLLFLGAFILPIAVGLAGFSQNMERATETKFCLSCHEMIPYGKSLYVDDSAAIHAAHFQNRLIPRDHACFTCHTDYSMFGDYKAKIYGLKHVYVHFLRPIPEKIELYKPFSNRNCLHCHEGMRLFEESKYHQTSSVTPADIKSGKISCISKGCHDTGHMVHELDDLDFWTPPNKDLLDAAAVAEPTAGAKTAPPAATSPAATTPSEAAPAPSPTGTAGEGK